MGGIQPFEGETRVAKAEQVSDTLDSVIEVTAEIDRTNEALSDLDDQLKILSQKHETYKALSTMVKRKMRRLSSEL